MSLPERLDLNSHTWIKEPATQAVMDAISPGSSDQARFVGGCVRNALMGHEVDDIDIASQLTPDQVVEALNGANIKVALTGYEHGTVTAIVSGKAFEITSLRHDVETFGRKAVVKFTTDWREDARRRDFRLNAIYALRDGQLFDPLGGIEDALNGQITFIGQAEDRIKEDHLRILRFYRFNAWYGQSIDPVGQAACSDLHGLLAELSVERVWKELKKLLVAPDPRGSVKAMQEGNILNELLPHRLDFKLLSSIIECDRGKSRRGDALIRLCALLGRDEDAMRAVLETMKASNAETAFGIAVSQGLAQASVTVLHPGMSALERARAAYRLGPEVMSARLRLDEAQGRGDVSGDLAFADSFEKPRLPVKGRDLIAAGFEAGPVIGTVLTRLEEAWIDSQFTLSKDALLKQAREWVS